MNIPSLTYSGNLLISAPKIHTDLLWDLSVLFIGLALVYFLGVFYFRNKISSNSKKVKERKRELSPMISEFLFLEDDASKDDKANYIDLKIEIRQLLKDAFNRKVLSEVLLDLRKDISGEAQQSLFRLYQDLGLHKDAFAKLKSWRWQVISKGIMDLTQMEVSESYSFITNFINDKRSTIRKQAEIATVTLRHEGINYFLDTTKYRISEWQQLKLLDVIRNKEDFQPPRFRAWLTSNNKYVVLFALRLIKYYNQNDANASLVELVKHKNSQIKEEAIACIKEFNVTDSLDTLKLVFWNSSITVKIAILDAISQIGSDADIEFINLIDKKELNFSVKSKALSTINAIAPESIMPSKGIQDESRYKMPDDITVAAAKIYAKKHVDISGDTDVEFIDDHTVEDLTSAYGDSSEIENVAKPLETPEMDQEIDDIAVNVTPVQESQEIETSMISNGIKEIHDIEVEAEQLIAEDERTGEIEGVATNWDVDHLNFIPLVVSEEDQDKTYVLKDMSDSNFTIPTQEVLNIQVVDEERVPNEETLGSKVNQPDKENASLLEKLELETWAFLPLVVENESETHDAPIDGFEDEKTSVLNITVQYEEVQINLPKENDETETPASAFELLNEPVHKLKDIKLPENSKNVANLYYAQYDTAEIHNATIVYEEISHHETEPDLSEIEVIEPFVFLNDNKRKQTTEIIFKYEEDLDDVELPIENEQLFQKIIDDLILVDRPVVDDLTKANDSIINPDWDLDEDDLAFTPVSFEKDREELPSYIKIENITSNSTDESVNIPSASIPKAIFGDIDFEASTRQLLNDLEEMGDQREIPFLKELLTHDTYDGFKERINNLIDTFNQDGAKEKPDNSIHPFSVFQDLFRTCDTESKMILLNEVVEVGDEKEIHFLEGLTEDNSPEIRKKALAVLKELRIKLEENKNDLKNQDARLSKEKVSLNFYESIAAAGLEPSSDPTDIFDLNFDLTAELDIEEDKNNNEKKRDDEE